ncbi:ATP-dependent (S)-NAD(P)H-hydrate dehydratase isoform X3 [Durio zibethinus]|uniref:ATP-dependent (S)-NAD(P)H-hydrate dehydratase n=1 Tax=Durio zibethinus TaxID=66656 RepID=A0A6P6AB36_DURZI|nr:ATP-dependent (S)-NAD(P)H-hydrate dehydratase isoform X3 [Durio zibethinus]
MFVKYGMNSGFSSLASPAVLRRQQFLIKSLGGYSDITHQKRMEAVKCLSGGASLEADAENVLRAITPSLDPTRHKGQAGKIAVIGGCREYTGAPYFAAISALKIECVSKIMTHARQSNVPMVVDGDGLFLVTNSVELVSGYPLAVLTPNVNEYKRLVQKVLGCEVNDQEAHGELLSLSKGMGCVTILRKGKSDLISDGEIVQSVGIYGSPRRCGGQGDILSGSVGVFLSWARQHILATERKPTVRDHYSPTNPTVLGCIAGSALLRKAASLAFEHKKRSTLTTDIIECLGQSLEAICPAS